MKESKREKRTRRWGCLAWQSPLFLQCWFCVEPGKQPDPVGHKMPCTGTTNAIYQYVHHLIIQEKKTAMHSTFTINYTTYNPGISKTTLTGLYIIKFIPWDNEMQLFNITGNWGGVLHTAQTKEGFEVQYRGYHHHEQFFPPRVNPKQVWLFILFFVTKWDALWSCVVGIHSIFWAWMAVSISMFKMELISLSNHKREECISRSGPTMIIQIRSKHSFRGTQKRVDASLK